MPLIQAEPLDLMQIERSVDTEAGDRVNLAESERPSPHVQ